MRLSRRGVLIAAGVTGLGGCAQWAPQQTGELLRSRIELPDPFTVPLPRPRVVRPHARPGRPGLIVITQREAAAELIPGIRTRILGYDGTFPGPLVDTRRSEPVIVRHVNETSVPTVAHLHGGHTAPDSDGFPTDLVEPGTSRDHHYGMEQRGATLWYHDHRMDFTGEQVYRGLFGVHVVRDQEEERLELPDGEREVPLVIVDRSFDEHGELLYPANELAGHGGHDGHPAGGADDHHVEGVVGDVMLVNGAAWPELEVESARYRFRILNGCNARRLDLALDPPPPEAAFVQIGSDGGLLEKPIAHPHLLVAQAERFDVVVDFTPYDVGQHVVLVNLLGQGRTRQVMRFVIVRRGRDHSAPPSELGRLSSIEPLDTHGARTRLWEFHRGELGDGRDGWLVNGRVFDPDGPQARVPLGEVEVWRFRADMHHPVHVHLDPFQVLSRSGRKIRPFDHGWKDTVDLVPGEEVEVAVRFTRHSGRYVLHCHNLEHEDRMMMAAFDTY